jgi:hypothetical protein
VVDLPLLLENGLAPPALLFDQVILSDYIGLVELARPSTPVRNLSLDYNVSSELAWLLDLFGAEEVAGLDALLIDIEYMIEQGVYAPAPAYLSPESKHNVALAVVYPALFAQPFDTTLYLDALQRRKMDVIPYIMRDLRRITEVSTLVEQRDVLQIVLKRMPIPRSNIPLQDVIQFRKDGEASRKLWALRNWANKIVKTADSPSQIDQLAAGQRRIRPKSRLIQSLLQRHVAEDSLEKFICGRKQSNRSRRRLMDPGRP